MQLGANHPMGPLELADFIGLDTCLAVMQVLYEGLADSKYRPCPLLVKYVEAGWLGRKAGPRLLRLSRREAGARRADTRAVSAAWQCCHSRARTERGSWGSCDDEVRWLSAALDSCPALVLNADFRPLSYYPLSLWSWQETVKAVCLDRVNIVSEYDHVVRSPSFVMRLPSVISLKEYIASARRPAFTRFNVFLRDRFICQYCGGALPVARPDLRPCRAALARRPHHVGERRHRLLELQSPQGQPAAGARARCIRATCRRQPTTHLLRENGRAFPPNFLHQSWRDFLYWDTELEAS